MIHMYDGQSVQVEKWACRGKLGHMYINKHQTVSKYSKTAIGENKSIIFNILSIKIKNEIIIDSLEAINIL